MAREPLEIGKHGKIGDRTMEDGRTKVWTRFRDLDGKVRVVEATATTYQKAVARLQGKLEARTKRAPDQVGKAPRKAAAEDDDREVKPPAPERVKLTRNSRVKDLRDPYLRRVQRKRKGSTYDTYRRWADSRIVPDIGEWRIVECTPGRLEDYFEDLETTESSNTGRPLSANSRRSIRKVVGGMLQVAVRENILDRNPVKDMDEIESTEPRRKPAAYSAKKSLDLFAAIDLDRYATRTHLNVLIKFLFFTACRIGEGLAVRWQEANLTDQPVECVDDYGNVETIPPWSVWINGNIVPVTGKGLVRYGGKTRASNGIVGLPVAMVDNLLVIRPDNPHPQTPIFPSMTGSWRDPNNTGKAIRRLRRRIGFPDFTSHLGRKTNGTALDFAGQSPRAIADQLRKASVSDTQNRYMGRGLANPDAAKLLDAFFRPAEEA